jgi:hypothetical protein
MLTRLDIVDMHLECVTQTLHTVQHPSLRSLHVGCHGKKDMDWEALCTVLSRSCFSSLHTLTVNCFMLEDDGVAHAQQSLARLKSRATYRFVNHPWSWGSSV